MNNQCEISETIQQEQFINLINFYCVRGFLFRFWGGATRPVRRSEDRGE